MKRTILVTGGNRGIGLATVTEVSKNSDDTILLGCRDIEGGNNIARELGKNVIAVKLDVSTRDGLAGDMKKILLNHPEIDVLINNAGVLNKESFTDINLETFDNSMRVNTIAPFELIKLVVPSMKKKSYGRIVNVSSGWGSFDEGLEGPFSYALTKAALNALTFTVSKDLPENILINSACPGWVRTRMGGEQALRSTEEGADTIVWLANLESDGACGKLFRDRKVINC